MEKKSTKIGYLIALVVVVVLMVVAKVTNDGSGFVGTIWSLFPPIIAIALALISKEVYSSLFIGVLCASLLATNFNIWEGVKGVMFGKYGDDGVGGIVTSADFAILVFLVILGIIVDLMNKAGGSAAFGRWAKKRVKSRAGAQLMSMALGILIFVDDYFNCLTVGAVMRPVTESHKISRAKLAYVIDATAAPVCMLAPVSSWAAAISSYAEFKSITGIQSFIAQIPYNYYCILTLVMIIVISLLNIDYGPMLTHEYNAQVKDDLFTTEHRPFAGDDKYEEGNKKSSVWDLILPVVVLIAACIIGMLDVGGFFTADSDYYHDFIGAFGDTSAGTALCIGGLIALLFTFVYYWLRGLISFSKSMESIQNGFSQMLAPILILCLAWALCATIRYGLNFGEYIGGVMSGAKGLANFLPAIVFVVACLVAFATGTSWGTIGIMVPLVAAIFNPDNPGTNAQLLYIGLAASCAGGVCGDHLSPISDTTIMASAGAHCYHLNHVSTQIPYGVTVAAVSFVMFIVAGFIQNWIICLAIGVVLMIAVLLVIKMIVAKKHAGIFEEMKKADAALKRA